MTHTLVIGGTRGIGRAVVRLFASQGHRVSVIARSPSEPLPPGVRCWTVDVVDEEGRSTAFNEILDTSGRLDNLVFLQRFRGAKDVWSGEVATSLTAPKAVIEWWIPRFSSPGAIVLVGSVAGRFVVHNQPVSYHVAKAGLVQMARYYAVKLGERGIRVNVVSPGTTVKEESRDYFMGNRPLYDALCRATPLRRLGTAEDVANVVAFLCSEAASFVTGQNIVVDGGASLQYQESLVRCILEV